ncbi:hypothetical protein FSOLCH5_001413 [Fusarium solani]
MCSHVACRDNPSFTDRVDAIGSDRSAPMLNRSFSASIFQPHSIVHQSSLMSLPYSQAYLSRDNSPSHSIVYISHVATPSETMVLPSSSDDPELVSSSQDSP